MVIIPTHSEQEGGSNAALMCVCVCVRARVCTYRSFATTVSQLKMCDFLAETFKGFEVL